MGVLILWLVAIAFTIPLTIFRGFVIVSLWNWFVITQFPQAPHISIVGAIGLAYFVSLFQHLPESKSKSDDPAEGAVELFGVSLKGGVITLVSWGLAYIIHCYM